jgi:hypothetical protein
MPTVFKSVDFRAAGLPATNNGDWDWKAGAEPVSRTVVAAIVADGNGCFAKHVLVSLLNMAGAVAIRTLFVDDHLAAVAVWFFTFKSLRPPMVF